MRVIIIFFFVSICNEVFCQKNIDNEFIFKMQLFLEKANVTNADLFEKKDMKLMLFFNQNIELTFDTLNTSGFSEDYTFLSLHVKDGIKYNEKIFKSDSIFYLFIAENCFEYVLAINKLNGKSYRLKGFNGNDLFSLFNDINKRFESLNQNKISMKLFLKRYSINGVDFNCLVKSIKSNEFNKIKYPCTIGCELVNVNIH